MLFIINIWIIYVVLQEVVSETVGVDGEVVDSEAREGRRDREGVQHGPEGLWPVVRWQVGPHPRGQHQLGHLFYLSFSSFSSFYNLSFMLLL